MKPIFKSGKVVIFPIRFLSRVVGNKEMLYCHCFWSFLQKYSIWKVSAQQEALKLNGSRQLLVCAYDVNLSVNNMQSVNKNTKYLLLSYKDIEQDVRADHTTYMYILLGHFYVGVQLSLSH